MSSPSDVADPLVCRRISAALPRVRLSICAGAIAALAAANTSAAPPLKRNVKTTVTCEQTAAKVISPMVDALAAAEDASAQYYLKNTLNATSILKVLDALDAARVEFGAVREQRRRYFDEEIAKCENAVREGRDDGQRQLSETRRLMDEARQKEHAAEAEKLAEQLRRIDEQFASGQRPVNGRSMKDWAELASLYKKQADQEMAKHDAGDYPIGHPDFGPITRNAADSSIKAHREELAKADRREIAYALEALGATLTGLQVDEAVLERRQKLAKTRADSAAGTLVVFVPTLGYAASRQNVQKLIDDAEKKLAETVAAWGRKQYKKFNPKHGTDLTNGAIEGKIAEVRKALADYQAKGDDALAYCFGADRRGTDVRKAHAAAVAAKNQMRINECAKMYEAWREARAKRIQKLQADIDHWRDIYREHHRLYEEDCRKQREHIDTHLAQALAETPCGTGPAPPPSEVMARHRRLLEKSVESPSELSRRLEDYDDRVYVGRDGKVHGNPRQALTHALRDTELNSPERASVAEWVLWAKGRLDWILAWSEGTGEFSEVWKAIQNLPEAQRLIEDAREATQTIDAFIRDMEALDPAKMPPDEFFKGRRQLRAGLDKVLASLEKGALNPDRMGRLIEAVRKGGGPSKAAIRMIRELGSVQLGSRAAAQGIKSLRKLGIFSDLTLPSAGNLAKQYRAFVSGSAQEVGDRLKGHFAGMSKFERGLLVLSAANAAAQAADYIQKGKDPKEALARASVNFVIEMVIGGVPVLAAADLATKALFVSYGVAKGDEVWQDANLEDAAKQAAQEALDKVVELAEGAGEASIVLQRFVRGEPQVEKLLANVGTQRLKASLDRAERELDALPPGDPREADLLRMRAAFRVLLRAKRDGA